MSTELTDRVFWKSFWESKKDLIQDIKKDYMFGDILLKRIQERNISSAIELGGFPGNYAIYLKKFAGTETALLDYFIHEDLVREMLYANGLKSQDIRIIEADLFSYEPQQLYDMVLSFGLIEHFNDTGDIIRHHLRFLKPGGTLFITLPNFKSVNGWVQKTFDPDNYAKHYIDCMDPELLSGFAEELGLKQVRAVYYGNFSVWLENKETKSVFSQVFVKGLWLGGKIITKLFPVKSGKLAPYIILEAVL